MVEPVRWPHGVCEWRYCGKRGRWLFRGEIRCGEHKDK